MNLERLLAVLDSETTMTLRILEALEDDALGRVVAPGHRSLQRLGWHLAQTIPEMMGRTGLSLEGPGQEDPPPASVREITEAYRVASESLRERLGEGWDDGTLEEVDEMYGERWPRWRTLTAFLLHQAHHRGQMTVLMRQAGLEVPGTHGPSRNEWAQWGMDPPEV